MKFFKAWLLGFLRQFASARLTKGWKAKILKPLAVIKDPLRLREGGLVIIISEWDFQREVDKPPGGEPILEVLNYKLMLLGNSLAILENNQTSEGIVIPEVLRPYCGFDIID